MKAFLDENFLLTTPTAERLYHDHAAKMPIIDYHCHLSPQDIAADRQFENLTQIWLEGDHYKWRAMRTNGVAERYCTGDASDWEKFEKWAETVPYTMRNPLYHWTHLELKRPFGITKTLNPSSARDIYDRCTKMLQGDTFTARGILKQMNVKVVCTTDDPTDDLAAHQLIRDSGVEIKVLPAFRPDKCLNAENPEALNAWLDNLAAITNSPMAHFIDLLDALKQRADFFESMGCKLSDHGLETAYADDFTDKEANYLFQKVRLGNSLEAAEISKYKSAVLFYLGEMYHEKGWIQQFHLGALRNNNSRMLRQLGPDTGFDSIGDFEVAKPLSRFLDRLDTGNTLPRTILYNLNPRDNEVMATMIGNFNDGSTPGKMQFGSAWWFLDQKDGMEKQIETLSNMGLLSRFVGMLTDSRSFLSYPRHEYFRRILCNMLGNDVETGQLPHDMEWLGQMVENICYHNARTYFDF
jgi:glucuronate isomerase